MKTSIIDVPDMLSVLTVDEVEKRFCEVSGVESATVNYAAGNATVRYDETRLEVADIKVLVHQRVPQLTAESEAKAVNNDKPETKISPKPPETPAPDAATVSAPAAAPPAADAHAGHKGHTMKDAPPAPATPASSA